MYSDFRVELWLPQPINLVAMIKQNCEQICVCPNPVNGSPSVYAMVVVAFNPPSPSRLLPNLSYKKQELFTLREKLGSLPVFSGFCFCFVGSLLTLLSSWVHPSFFLWFMLFIFLVFSIAFLFCFVIAVSSVRCCLCFWIVHSWLPLRVSLTLVYKV